jgi:PKD repeat protein
VNGVNTCGSGTATSLSNLPVVVSPAASFTESAHTANTGVNVSVTFTGTAPAGTTYTWSFDGGTATPGTGAGPQSVVWTSLGTKTVTLTLDNNGCSSTYTDTVQVSKNNGINTVGLDAIDAINVVPNPSSGQTNIIISMASETNITIAAYDMAGRLVSTIYSGDLGTGEKSIAFHSENISSGIYLIKATDGRSFVQKRFVKL